MQAIFQNMWTLLAFISALCLGGYDISKKIALRENRVIDVLTLSICISAVLLSVPLVLSRVCPEMMEGTAFYVPRLDMRAHGYVVVKSMIVLSSWVFAYISLKHLPLSVVSPMQATRPMWTLVGALVLFDERLNGWQWLGVLLAIGSIFVFSLKGVAGKGKQLTMNNVQLTEGAGQRAEGIYYAALAAAILIGACAGLYDKYLMLRYDHNAVQVYYTLYQAAMMIGVWALERVKRVKGLEVRGLEVRGVKSVWAIGLISVFLVISDNVYMLALRDPDSLIAIVSTIRRGGAVIGFAYGLLCLKEKDPLPKILCMVGICAGLVCLAIGSA